MTLNWDGILGHKKQIDLLSKSIEQDHLAHAYIFAGPKHIGKKLVSQKLAQILLCEQSNACNTCSQCKIFTARSNPDYFEIAELDTIKIEAVRDLSFKLALKPYSGRYKIAVIDNAETMTDEAANALLKVLEEPKDHTILILITDNVYNLLPTISSRAQKIFFSPVEESGSDELVNLDPEVFAGKPGLIQSIKQDENLSQQYKRWQESYKIFNSEDLVERLIVAAESAEQESFENKKMLEFWLEHLRLKLRQAADLSTTKQIKGVVEALKGLDQNANTKLLLSTLMLKTQK